jgi:plastocyanin
MTRTIVGSAIGAAAWLFAAALAADTLSGAAPRDTVVWLVGPGVPAQTASAHAVMDQRSMHFLPHVLAVEVGTTVEFENHDTVVHNVFSPDACAGSFDLGTWGPGGTRSQRFDRPCKATILCSLHPDMEAWVVVVPSPHFAVAGPDGRYLMKDVPAGAYTLKAWRPEDGPESSAEVVVKGATTKDVSPE